MSRSQNKDILTRLRVWAYLYNGGSRHTTLSQRRHSFTLAQKRILRHFVLYLLLLHLFNITTIIYCKYILIIYLNSITFMFLMYLI